MDISISKSFAKGIIKAPPSKSMAHRYIICAALSSGESIIENVDFSQDILATIDCIKALGAKIDVYDSSVKVKGIDFDNLPADVIFPCRESGSTMRFFMGIALCLGIKSKFLGSETLRNRPFGIYEDLCAKNHITFLREEDCILIDGKLNSGRFEIAGNVSSQFITGLMFVLPLKGEDSIISIIPPIESRSYLNLTLQAMQDFGIEIDWNDSENIGIKKDQKYVSRNIEVEGDYSNAAFLDAFNTVGGDVSVVGLRNDSLQGDSVYSRLYAELTKGKATIDISDCPDLGPVLFSVAAANHGGIFTGTRRLKMKESDRGTVMCEELSKFGVESEIEENSIIIGTMNNDLRNINTNGHNDHRIVMSMSLLLSLTGGTISGAEAVKKSYPSFFENIKSLGIEVN